MTLERTRTASIKPPSHGNYEQPREFGVSVAESARRAAAAHRRYAAELWGFYVANDRTGIVVAGPFKTERTARQQADLREPPTMKVIAR